MKQPFSIFTYVTYNHKLIGRLWVKWVLLILQNRLFTDWWPFSHGIARKWQSELQNCKYCKYLQRLEYISWMWKFTRLCFCVCVWLCAWEKVCTGGPTCAWVRKVLRFLKFKCVGSTQRTGKPWGTGTHNESLCPPCLLSLPN